MVLPARSAPGRQMSSDAPIGALKALAHPARFAILDILSGGERNVGEVEELSGIAQPALSQQLAVLRNAGLVRTRKNAKLVFYRVHQENMAALLQVLAKLTEGTETRPNRTSPRNPNVANFARLVAD